jgi:hypothetical protein
MGRNRLLRLSLLLVLFVLPACSAIVTYTDLASWQQVSAQSGATIDFSSLAQNPGNYSAQVLALSAFTGVTFSSPGDFVQVVNPASYQPWYQWNSGAILRAYNDTGSGTLKVDFATPITAFAALMGINSENPPGTWVASQMTITARSGSTTLTLPSPTYSTTAHPGLTFFGIVSTTPGQTFDSITFAPAVNYAFLDDVRLGSFQAAVEPPPTSDTPEPGTGLLALCGAALIVAGKLRSRRRQN